MNTKQYINNLTTEQKNDMVSMLQYQGFRSITSRENEDGTWNIEADFWGLG